LKQINFITGTPLQRGARGKCPRCLPLNPALETLVLLSIFNFSVANQTVYNAFHGVFGISLYHFTTVWSRQKALNSLRDRIETAVVSKVCKTNLLWQFPSKEEEQHTFRTTPREHWWIWSEFPSHAQVNS